MTIVSNLIDKAKAKTSMETDRALADHFGIHRQAISKWRNGESWPDEDHIIQMAEMAKDDPAEWLVAIKAVRSNGAVKRAWQAIAKRIAATTTAIAIAIWLAATTPQANANQLIYMDNADKTTYKMYIMLFI